MKFNQNFFYKESVDKVCEQPKKQGLCKAKLSRYFFNSETRKCELFDYGGCMGNENNFQTEEECQNKCVTLKQTVSVKTTGRLKINKPFIGCIL